MIHYTNIHFLQNYSLEKSLPELYTFKNKELKSRHNNLRGSNQNIF